MDDVTSRGSGKPRHESPPGRPAAEITNRLSDTESFATVLALHGGRRTGSSVETSREKEALWIAFCSLGGAGRAEGEMD